jgi:hypothetical protein
MKRAALVICLAVILLLALGVPAFADTSGTVYGKAILAPVAIVLSGSGLSGSAPLVYEGTYAERVSEKFDSEVTVQNAGTHDVQIILTADQSPTNGANTWAFTDDFGPDAAEWTFSPGLHTAWVLPETSPRYDSYNTIDYSLGAGNSDVLNSQFRFPSSSGSTADHYMSATISAVDNGDSNNPLPPPDQ